MRGKSPIQFDLYARDGIRHLTRGERRDLAERNWTAVIIRTTTCRLCEQPPPALCRYSSKRSKGGPRKTPHQIRMIQAIQRFQNDGGCEICHSIDWMIPRTCTCGRIHGVCHGCWDTPLLRAVVPPLLSRCPSRLTEADKTLITLAHRSL